MIYTLVLLACGTGATAWLAVEIRRTVRSPHRVDGAAGAVALVASEALLVAGIASFASAGITHIDGVDIGSVWVAPVGVLAAVAVLAARQPRLAAQHLVRGAAMLVGLMTLLTALTYVADRGEFNGTSFGPLVESTVFVAVPALVTAAFLGLATRH